MKLVNLALILILSIAGFAAEDDAATTRQVAAFQKAMAGQDFQAKKQALSSLLRVREDSVVYPLLIQALNDRQAASQAIKALRARAGLQPSKAKGGNAGYPGYPTADTAAGWSAWNAARQKEIADKQALEEAKKQAEEAAAKAEEAKEAAAEGDDAAEQEGDEATVETSEGDDKTESVQPVVMLGKLDRIFFKDGSILVGYVTVSRRDMTGKLTSIHIVHPGSGGEEDVDAALISRIEEDFE